MNYAVHVEPALPARPVAVVRRRAALADLPRVVPQYCGLVHNAIRAANVQGAGRLVAVYVDDEVNLEVGVELDAPLAGRAPADSSVVASALPGGQVATATHLGPYAKLGDAHTAIRDWCRARGLALAGPNWEVYAHWDDAWTADPSSIRTDVFYLLATGRDRRR